jgi:predicted alpha/beta hydrolase family esterase
MTKNVLFIHGAGEQSEAERDGPLAALRAGLGPGTRLAAPIMPTPGAPDAAAWEAALGEHLRLQQVPLVLVGHSLGGSMIFKYLAKHGVPAGLAGVVSIAAPFWGMPDWDQQEWRLPRGFETRLAELPRIALYHSRDDEVVPVSHVDRYAKALPKALVHKVDGRGHMFDDGNVADILEDIAGAFEAHAGVRHNSNA